MTWPWLATRTKVSDSSSFRPCPEQDPPLAGSSPDLLPNGADVCTSGIGSWPSTTWTSTTCTTEKSSTSSKTQATVSFWLLVPQLVSYVISKVQWKPLIVIPGNVIIKLLWSNLPWLSGPKSVSYMLNIAFRLILSVSLFPKGIKLASSIASFKPKNFI